MLISESVRGIAHLDTCRGREAQLDPLASGLNARWLSRDREGAVQFALIYQVGI